MTTIPPCPSCNSPYAYEMDNKLVCPECAFEWMPEAEQEPAGLVVKDANGNILKLRNEVERLVILGGIGQSLRGEMG